MPVGEPITPHIIPDYQPGRLKRPSTDFCDRIVLNLGFEVRFGFFEKVGDVVEDGEFVAPGGEYDELGASGTDVVVIGIGVAGLGRQGEISVSKLVT